MNKATALLFTSVMVLSLVLTFIWFKDGYILGTAEAVIPFYNVERYYHQVKDAWADNNPGLGVANGIVTAYAPTYFALSLLQNLGIPGFIVQATFFWFILTSAGIGIFFLMRELFPKIHLRFVLIAILFYFFNPVSLVNVWNRFLFNYMVFWAFLPIATYLFIKGLNSGKYIYAFSIGISSIIFSLALSALVFNILLWLLFAYITLFWIVIQKDKVKKLFYIKFFTSTLIYFCFVNFWWIGQVLTYLTSGKFTTDISSFFEHDLTTLTSLSKLLGNLTDVFVLKHGTFFSTTAVEWAKSFEINYVVFIEFFITGVILLYMIQNLKNLSALFLGTTFFLGIFLAKGTNPPFGEIFQFFFEKVNILHSFRNTFEKFGFVIALAAAPILGASLEYLWEKFKIYGKIIYVACLLALVFLYGYPFFSSWVFTGNPPPTNDYSIGYKVKVPLYYKEADSWLTAQGDNFRLMGFPIKDQGVTYKWEKGYQGIEPSSLLFSTPNILLNTTVPYYEKVVSELEKLLLNSKNFPKVANALNAKYILVRFDVDYSERGMRDPEIIKRKIIDGQNELKKVSEFGNLTFWENTLWEDRKIYPVNSLISVSPQARISDFTLSEYRNNLGFIGDSSDPTINSNIAFRIIYPDEDKTVAYEDVKKYNFNIQNEGIYEVILDTYYIENIKDKFIPPQILVDENNIPNEAALRADGRLSYGKIKFSEGSHVMNILVQQTKNFIDTGFQFIDFNPYIRYFFSFDYVTESDNACRVIINQDNNQVRDGKMISVHFRNLSGSSGNYRDFFEPQDTASAAELNFLCEGGGIVIKNAQVRGLLESKPILVKEETSVGLDLPQISYTKEDKTLYKVDVKGAIGPFILIFSELFDNGWRLKLDDNTIVDKHFLVNSYANGWYVEGLGDFNLTIEFAPEQVLRTGRMVSTVSVLSGGILIIFFGIVKKFKKN